MRLLNIDTFTFSEHYEPDIPTYAIASHRWIKGCETSKKDVEKRRNTSRLGYGKVLSFAKSVKYHFPMIKHLWVDTCCIDQKNSQEVSEAINSMWKWYSGAAICLAYLCDVTDLSDFDHSQWFRRGWTLQELIAPWRVLFLSKDWRFIGHKLQDGGEILHSALDFGPGSSCIARIARITQIPATVLRASKRRGAYSVETRLSWMKNRQTLRPEDIVYGLIGLMDAPMVVNYGEGASRARRRLKQALEAEEEDDAAYVLDEMCPSVPLDKNMSQHVNYSPRALDDRLLARFVETCPGTVSYCRDDPYSSNFHCQQSDYMLENRSDYTTPVSPPPLSSHYPIHPDDVSFHPCLKSTRQFAPQPRIPQSSIGPPENDQLLMPSLRPPLPLPSRTGPRPPLMPLLRPPLPLPSRTGPRPPSLHVSVYFATQLDASGYNTRAATRSSNSGLSPMSGFTRQSYTVRAKPVERQREPLPELNPCEEPPSNHMNSLQPSNPARLRPQALPRASSTEDQEATTRSLSDWGKFFQDKTSPIRRNGDKMIQDTIDEELTENVEDERQKRETYMWV